MTKDESRVATCHLLTCLLTYLLALLHLTVLLVEVGADDGDGQRQHHQTPEHDEHGCQLPYEGDRVDVAITDSGHRDEAPPHGGWDRLEGRGRAVHPHPLLARGIVGRA
eukprot:scaffold21347_cov33-Phaeocystis_antarctica.AAC.2